MRNENCFRLSGETMVTKECLYVKKEGRLKKKLASVPQRHGNCCEKPRLAVARGEVVQSQELRQTDTTSWGREDRCCPRAKLCYGELQE